MKIIGIGRNYAEHAHELGNELPQAPLLFFKPDTALLRNNAPFYFPDFSQEIHHEIELVARLGQPGKAIAERFAPKYIEALGLGIDFTARDLQRQAKANGQPWTLAKGFDHSAAISALKPATDFPNWNNLALRLDINGETRQEGNTTELIFRLPFLVHYISQFITLKKGDLIFTGTPSGVGPVQIGDHLCGYLNQEKMLDFRIK